MSVPFCRTKLFQIPYFNRIAKLWNNLPPFTRSSSSVSILRLYKHYLIALSNSFVHINALLEIILLVHQLAAINVSCCVLSIYALSFHKLFLLFNVN